MLARLPEEYEDTTEAESETSMVMDDSIVSFLKSMHCGDNKGQRKRRKKVTVTPGEGVLASDLSQDEEVNDNDANEDSREKVHNTNNERKVNKHTSTSTSLQKSEAGSKMEESPGEEGKGGESERAGEVKVTQRNHSREFFLLPPMKLHLDCWWWSTSSHKIPWKSCRGIR